MKSLQYLNLTLTSLALSAITGVPGEPDGIVYGIIWFGFAVAFGINYVTTIINEQTKP